MAEAAITLAAPLEHQEPIVASRASRKAVRWGRRGGKTRIAFYCAIVGHGPETDGTPLHRGVVHGMDVVWIVRDMPQAGSLWQEEITPRFKGVPGVYTNETEKRIELAGGKLWIRSAENIASVRGVGKNLIGVIVDEAAWQDLEAALKKVILPALLDNNGWLMLISTTNSGHDGNQQGRVPSYFNVICDEIQAGKRSDEWEEFYATAFDNPKISTQAINELIAEYTPGSIDLEQEVYAKLVTGGAGVAFPEWSPLIHVADYAVPADWRWSAGGDYGYEAYGWIGLFASGPERSLCRWDWYFKGKDPYTLGFELGKHLMRFPRPEWIAIDTPPVPDGGPTILERIQEGLNDACKPHPAPPCVNPPKGPGSRITGKVLLHGLLRPKVPVSEGPVTPDKYAKLKQWQMPGLQFHPECKDAIRTIPKLALSLRDTRDVDTKAEDHPYDGVRSWIMARTPHVQRNENAEPEQNRHPGFKNGGRRRFDDDDEPVQVGGRFQRARIGSGDDEDEGGSWDE